MSEDNSNNSRSPVLLLGLFCTLALWSCTGGSGAAADPPKPTTHTVTIEAVHFDPEALTIRPGESVVWVNKDPFPHNVKSDTNGVFQSQPINAGESWTHTFAASGEVAYVCTLHPTMKAVVRVK